MGNFRIAILGCGTVGGGVAKILLDNQKELAVRAGVELELAGILDLFPSKSAERHGVPLKYFLGNGKDLTKEEAAQITEKIMKDTTIDLVVETIGGSSDYVFNTVKSVLTNKKHLATANKALLAKYGKEIFETAKNNGKSVGFEASVCGAIPIIKGINECFTGDIIETITGIMNGTSNYILSKMNNESLSFETALKGAQEKGYAEADPTLDINGGDAGHKLCILMKLIFGMDIKLEQLDPKGIDTITGEDTKFAHEIDSVIKLICYAKRNGNDVYATVRPMMVKKENLLSDINNATNAVKMENLYSQQNILIGQGAGSLETGSAIVSDIVFIARYGDKSLKNYDSKGYTLKSFNDLIFPYNIIFETEDYPGITGLITTAIGDQNINIDTVSHNMRSKETALFSIATKPCSYSQITRAIEAVKSKAPKALIRDPKIIPILY